MKMSWFAILASLGLSAMTLLGSKPAMACSCAPSTTAQLVGFATEVYRGSVVIAETPGDESTSRSYRLIVSDVWKGNVAELETATTFLSLCGIGLDEGEDYLVFANRGLIDICSGTKKISHASGDLAALGASQPPESASMLTAFRNAQISGTWYEPDRPGQGLQIQVLPDGRVAVTFFGHLNAGNAEQAWLVGIGEFVGEELRVPDVSLTRSSGFGAQFNASQANTVAWGSFLIRLRGTTLEFSYQSELEGFSSLSSNRPMEMQRLTRAPVRVLFGDGAP